jgi:hypothetical protein
MNKSSRSHALTDAKQCKIIRVANLSRDNDEKNPLSISIEYSIVTPPYK